MCYTAIHTHKIKGTDRKIRSPCTNNHGWIYYKLLIRFIFATAFQQVWGCLYFIHFWVHNNPSSSATARRRSANRHETSIILWHLAVNPTKFMRETLNQHVQDWTFSGSISKTHTKSTRLAKTIPHRFVCTIFQFLPFHGSLITTLRAAAGLTIGPLRYANRPRTEFSADRVNCAQTGKRRFASNGDRAPRSICCVQ